MLHDSEVPEAVTVDVQSAAHSTNRTAQHQKGQKQQIQQQMQACHTLLLLMLRLLFHLSS